MRLSSSSGCNWLTGYFRTTLKSYLLSGTVTSTRSGKFFIVYAPKYITVAVSRFPRTRTTI